MGQIKQDFNEGLLALIAGLRGGMDPSTAYGIYGDVAGVQAQAVAARQQRLAGLTDLLTQGAMGGMTYDQAQTLGQVQPGGFGPQAQAALDQLYPAGSGSGYPTYTPPAPGTVDPLAGTGQPELTQPGQQTSTLMQPPDPLAQLQAQAAAVTAQQTIAGAGQPNPQDALGALVSGISAAKANGASPDQIKASVMADPALRGVYAENYSKIIQMFPELGPFGGATSGF